MKYSFIIIALLLLSPFYLKAEYTVEGKIKDTKGEPVAGATVKVDNTVIGTYTDKNGDFKLAGLPEKEFSLTVTAVGFKSKKALISPKGKELNITLTQTIIQSEEVVVTANRSEQIYENTPVKVSVMSGESFENVSSCNLRDGLAFQPGLRIENNCQNCGFSEVRINGMEGKYSQILIDSKPLFSSLNGVYGLEQIPTAMIDRVEVIRGGGSSLYGGNAVAGVINVITKDPYLNSFNVNLNSSMTGFEAGDHKLNLNASFISDNQKTGLVLFGSHRTREAFDANGDDFSEISKLKNTSFGSSFFYKPDMTKRFGISYNILTDEIRGGNEFNKPMHLSDITEAASHYTHIGQADFEYKFGSGGSLSLFSSFQKTTRNTYYGTGESTDGYGKTNNLIFSSGAQISEIINTSFGSHFITAGYEFKTDDMEDKVLSYERSIDQSVVENGLYLQNDWTLTDHWNIVLGSRFDKHSLIDNFIISPRANLMYKVNEDINFRANYSTGYRAPQTFDEDLHIAAVGGTVQLIQFSDELKEERSESYGISADYMIDTWKYPISLSLEYFHTNLYDVFILEEDGVNENGNMILRKKNGNSGYVRGTTFEVMAEFFEKLFIKTGFTYQKSIYSTPVQWSDDAGSESNSTKVYLRTPDLYGYFNMDIEILKDLKLFISGVYTGSMDVPHYAGGIGPDGTVNKHDVIKETRSFLDITSKITWKFNSNPELGISIGMYNVFDQYQDDFDRGMNRDAGYIYGPMKPRSVFIELETSL